MAAKVRRKKYHFFESCDNIEDLMRNQKFILQRLKKKIRSANEVSSLYLGLLERLCGAYTKLCLIS